MVTEILVKESLSEEMISAGSDLIRRLDAAGSKISGALWFYETDSNDWRLIIVSPDVQAKGIRTVYEEVQAVLRATPDDQSIISLKDISVVSPDDPLNSLLKFAIKTDNGISRIRFSRNMINGTLIEDSYIYRLT
jgi:hypothetical protein